MLPGMIIPAALAHVLDASAPLADTRMRRPRWPALSGSGMLRTRRAASLAVSIEPELAINGAQICWPEQGLVGDAHTIERSVQIGAPKRQEESVVLTEPAALSGSVSV